VVSPTRSRVGTRYTRYMSKALAVRLPACTLPSTVGALGRKGIIGKVPRHGNSPLIRPGCFVATIRVLYDPSDRRGKPAGRSQKGDESWGESWRVETPHILAKAAVRSGSTTSQMTYERSLLVSMPLVSYHPPWRHYAQEQDLKN
jgi:hypothetical protein